MGLRKAASWLWNSYNNLSSAYQLLIWLGLGGMISGGGAWLSETVPVGLIPVIVILGAAGALSIWRNVTPAKKSGGATASALVLDALPAQGTGSVPRMRTLIDNVRKIGTSMLLDWPGRYPAKETMRRLRCYTSFRALEERFQGEMPDGEIDEQMEWLEANLRRMEKEWPFREP